MAFEVQFVAWVTNTDTGEVVARTTNGECGATAPLGQNSTPMILDQLAAISDRLGRDVTERTVTCLQDLARQHEHHGTHDEPE